MAVGLSLDGSKVAEFRKRINDYCRDIVMPYNKQTIDCKLNPAELHLSLVEQIKLLEPFGCANPTPVFGLYNMRIVELKPIGNNRHMRFTLKRNDATVTALYFGLAVEDCSYRLGDVVDLAVTLDKNEFRGQENLSVVIRDIKYSNCNNQELIDSLRVFEKFASHQSLTAEEAREILPTREDFAYVYRFLKSNNGFSYGEYGLLKALDYKIKTGKLRVILHTMKELGLIKWTQGLYKFHIQLLNSGKVNLDESVFIRKLKAIIKEVH
jgi:single-stranded-DNA-specific exonuclease